MDKYNYSDFFLKKSDYYNFKPTKSYRFNNIVIKTKSNELGFNRLGLAISKKGLNSIKRNRLKRIIKQFFIDTVAKVKVSNSKDYLIVRNRSKIDFSAEEIYILKVLKRISKESFSDR